MIDISKFFITYTPYRPDDKEATNPFNPYSSVNLDTYSWPETTTEKSSDLWESLGWKSNRDSDESSSEVSTSSSTTSSTSSSTSASTSNKPVSNPSDTQRRYFEKMDQKVRESVQRNRDKLGIRTNEEFELAVKCIIAQDANESGWGTNLQFKYNNPGGLKWTESNAKYGGSRGNKSPEHNNYTHFNTLANGIECQVANFYGSMPRYRNLFVGLKSPEEYAYRLKRMGYYGGNADEYASGCAQIARKYEKWKYGH